MYKNRLIKPYYGSSLPYYLGIELSEDNASH